jgi:hypothetical protein
VRETSKALSESRHPTGNTSAEVMVAHPPPGPLPLPSPGLSGISLPTKVVPAGEVLYRIHRIRPRYQEPLFFGPRAPQRGRWDSPTNLYGICYLAVQPWAAFAETFLRQKGRRNIENGDIDARGIAVVELHRDLVLASLDGPDLTIMGADASVVHGHYNCTAAWAEAIHVHPDGVDGIYCAVRHDNHGFGASVFDRAGDALELLESIPLCDNSVATELASWLDRYHLRLI